MKLISRLVFLSAAAGAAWWLAAARPKAEKRYFNLNNAKPPGYTHVVTSGPGKMVFISGQGGTDATGKLPEDFSSQAQNTFENIGKCLALAGARFEDIVKINYFVTDMASTAELRKVRARYLNMERPPASTLVQAGLGKGMLLEVEAIAVIPE